MLQQDFFSNQPIVIDNGSGVMKAGLAGVERPSCEIRSYVGYSKYDKVMENDFAPLDNMWVGSEIDSRRGLCCLKYPIRHGVIEDWDAMRRIWRHIYSKAQLGRNFEDHPVLLEQAAISPNKQSEKMAEIFLEEFKVPAIFIAPQPLLSLYAARKDTGVVVDIGEGVTTIFPIYNGYAISPHIHRSENGGREITNYLQLLLRKSGSIFSTSSEFEVVREIKEACCECATLETASSLRDSTVNYVLPDGQAITIGNERWQAAEAYFNPQLVGSEALGIPHQLQETIMACDMDLRKELIANVVLSGGGTMMRNFGKRLLEEMKTVVHANTKVRLIAPPERNRSAWVGGCLLASLSPFRDMWISRKDYEEQGCEYVYKKALI